MKICSLLTAIALTSSQLQAEELPVWPVHWMCAEAGAIIVGERVGANRVKVLEWLLPPADEKMLMREIEISFLDQHSRLVGAGIRPAGEAIGKVLKTQRFVCFLERRSAAWRSMATVGAGSSGVVWIEEGKCYRYEQEMNPGPLGLTPFDKCSTEKNLRAEIAQGLKDRREWLDAQAIVHPQEKSIVLTSYLLARTSPEGTHGTYRQRVRQVLPKLGRHAVEELVELLRTIEPDDQLGEAVLVLHDMGPKAAPAVPYLVTLLKRTTQVQPARVLEALGRIGDASVAPKILALLQDESLQIRAEVATAMARFRYQDSAPAIVKALPGKVEQQDAYHVYAMLLALKELDPASARAATLRFAKDPAMEHVKNLLEPFLRE